MERSQSGQGPVASTGLTGHPQHPGLPAQSPGRALLSSGWIWSLNELIYGQTGTNLFRANSILRAVCCLGRTCTWHLCPLLDPYGRLWAGTQLQRPCGCGPDSPIPAGSTLTHAQSLTSLLLALQLSRITLQNTQHVSVQAYTASRVPPARPAPRAPAVLSRRLGSADASPRASEGGGVAVRASGQERARLRRRRGRPAALR